ncbi:DUF4267 domain-containing protein [Kribbella qitaiheensis]|uniref:DUF4267 domain-containing protein n=1 Tax=Kribbella qitaiheensis TaxID=1544730 RepID=A0A7G6WWN1_9ACTN|nr:DUF4267 domain-containing protein [Kribbella qitaiheensis]QNE18396.1 DUF4267 domain-containing protein [Kribbella qitaiheensis]
MSLRRFTSILTVVLALAPISFGLRFLLDPHGAASGFGIDPWPTGNAAGYFLVKAGRDLFMGIVLLVLFALRERRATAIAMALVTMVPIVDMITVFTHGGSAATALGIHGLTALIVAADAYLLFRTIKPTEAAAALESSGTQSVAADHS